ncbi:hypothetical protein [Desulfosarcina ovata]|uniref:TsaA-like domain-containing protein n=1 Tax=Desulfosarcina ovata subsp. ovata TaxID=2752305 RepID=A0A5K8ACC5_9BACT|nr:hypothetical protein [Desulfosarcina ovata]BBO90166.1 hypothetical protein DSCOOX_33460 [Desulfosarcina ovata subsp. ovata]
MKTPIAVHSIGYVRKKNDATRIDIDPQYQAALLVMDGFSHII